MSKKPRQENKVKLTEEIPKFDGKPQKQTGAPTNDQDPKRRLGNYAGAGEHPRQGGREGGIVGQSKQKNHTD